MPTPSKNNDLTATYFELNYFAVTDPDTGDMTYWYRTERGIIKPWPLNVGRYGPQLPDTSGLSPQDGAALVQGFVRSTVLPWRRAVMARLEADPVAAAALFSVSQERCCRCGVTLNDASKMLGIGTFCGQVIEPGLLEVLAREIERIHDQPLPVPPGIAWNAVELSPEVGMVEVSKDEGAYILTCRYRTATVRRVWSAQHRWRAVTESGEWKDFVAFEDAIDWWETYDRGTLGEVQA